MCIGDIVKYIRTGEMGRIMKDADYKTGKVRVLLERPETPVLNNILEIMEDDLTEPSFIDKITFLKTEFNGGHIRTVDMFNNGEFIVIEAEDTSLGQPVLKFYAYHNFKPINEIFDSKDGAIIGILDLKYHGINNLIGATLKQHLIQLNSTSKSIGS